MSLNWTNTTPTAEWAELHPYTRESIIFRTMFLGVNPLTEDNVRKFFGRSADWDEAHGNTEPYLSLEDCRAGVGVSSNASTLTDAAFKRKLGKITKLREAEAAEAAYAEHAKSYAAKFAAETVCAEPAFYEEPSDENLKARFANCGVKPRNKAQYAQIREEFRRGYFGQIAAAAKV